MNPYVFDIETTGLEKPVTILELSYVKVNLHGLIRDESGALNLISLDEPFSTLVNPGIPIPLASSAVHGIFQRDIDAANPPFIHEVELPTEPLVFVSHNVPFDRPPLDHRLNIVDELCTLQMATRLLPDAPNHKLSTLAEYCDLSEQTSHQAKGDVIHCVELLLYLMDGTGWSFEELLAFSKKQWVFKKMPWGKHKGTPMSDIPSGYLYWLDGLDDLSVDMRLTVDTEIRRRR